jgi:perosamine synthetase
MMLADKNMKLPLSKPFVGNEESEAILKVIESKSIASGSITKKLEVALANKYKRKYCVVVNSGTSALYLALKVVGLKNVILPALTCSNVLHALLNAGPRPVFCDVESETHNIDLTRLSEEHLNLSDGLIVTHAYGHSADMDEIADYVKKYDLMLIEDFSQGMGGSFKDRSLGSFGNVSITSFYATKNMTTGHGGAIFSDDQDIYQKCLYGRGDQIDIYYDNIIPMNLRMTDIQAAIGLVQLNKIDSMINMRRSNAHKLNTLLNEIKVKTPVEKPTVKHAYYKYHIVLPENINKSEFIAEMDKEGVSTGILYDPPLHKMILAKKMIDSKFSMPVSENVAPRTVSLPMFPEMTEGDILKIHDAIDTVLGKPEVYNKN